MNKRITEYSDNGSSINNNISLKNKQSIDSFIYHTKSRETILNNAYNKGGFELVRPKTQTDLNYRVNMNKNFNNYLKPQTDSQI